jgi:hypothetical protein
MARQIVRGAEADRFHAREAASALMKMAKATCGPKVAGGIVEAAGNIKERTGELSTLASRKPPDVQ